MIDQNLIKAYWERYYGNDEMCTAWRAYIVIMYVMHPDVKWTLKEIEPRFKKILEKYGESHIRKMNSIKCKELRMADRYQQFKNAADKYCDKHGLRYLCTYGH